MSVFVATVIVIIIFRHYFPGSVTLIRLFTCLRIIYLFTYPPPPPTTEGGGGGGSGPMYSETIPGSIDLWMSVFYSLRNVLVQILFNGVEHSVT